MFSPLQFQFGSNSAPVIHIIHENDTWLEPLRLALAERGLPHVEWFIDDLVLDLSAPPPNGVFYNRMSASSHTRDHRFAWYYYYYYYYYYDYYYDYFYYYYYYYYYDYY